MSPRKAYLSAKQLKPVALVVLSYEENVDVKIEL